MAKISINILPQLKKWFLEKENLITNWSNTSSDDKIPSEKLVKSELNTKAIKTEVDTALDTKISKSDIKTAINNTLTDSDIVSGKSVYEEIKKVESGIPSGMTHSDITDWDTAVSTFEKTTNKVTKVRASDATDNAYPSEKAVSDALSVVQDDVIEKYATKTSLTEELSKKIDSSTKTNDLTNTSSNDQIPSAKAVYDLYSTIPKWHVEMVASIDELPTTGVVGTIYLIPDDGNGKNQYKEFFWNDSSDEPGYEAFGGVEMDVSKFITKKQMTDYLANNSTLTLSDSGELALNITDATD